MKTKIYKLDNGITVAIVPLRGIRSVTIEVFFKIGSKYESKNEFGMSHFLEHMAFKGTKKRPTASEINREIDSKGAEYNAGTGYEMTSYYITTVKDNIPWAVELLSDMLTNSIFDKKEVAKEKGVIMEEIKMYNDNPLYGLSTKIIDFLYGETKIGCWNIIGKISDIEDISREKVINFRNKFVNSKEMVVVLAGNVDESVFGEVEKYFGSFVDKFENSLPKIEIILSKNKNKEIRKQVEQGHFAMVVPAVSWNDKRKYAFKLLDIILSGNSSSRLYQKIREDGALAYYVHPISEMFEETGFWGIQSGVRLEKINEVIQIVKEELKIVSNTLVEDELIRSKDYLLGKMKLMMDRSGYWASYYGRKLLLEKKGEAIEDELSEYRKIKLEELKDLARKIFVEDKIRTILIKNK